MSKPEIVIRPTTAEDIRMITGENAPLSLRAVTACVNGKPVAVAGIASNGVIFSNFTGADVSPIIVWRQAKKMLAMIREFKMPGVTSPCQGRSRFLESLGLELAHIQENQHFYRI